MSLFEKLQEDRKEAFKAKNTVKKDILNFVLAQLKNKKIELHREPNDDEVMQTIKKEIKTREEWLMYMEKGGDTAWAAIEHEKIAILKTYLPAQLSQEQVRLIVQQKIDALWITEVQKQKGQLMGAILKEYGQEIDGRMLQEILSSYA